MFRRIVAVILTLCMCWQSLAFAGADLVLADAHDHLHELLHFEGTAHHHDDHDRHAADHAINPDGDLHQDDSTESVVHVSADASVYAPALLPVPALLLPAPQPIRPELTVLTAHSHPFLDGLERPPRFAA